MNQKGFLVAILGIIIVIIIILAIIFSITTMPLTSGDEVEKDYPLAGIVSNLQINGQAHLFLTQGTETSLKIVTGEKIHNLLKIEEDSDQLTIGLKSWWLSWPWWLNKNLNIYLTTPTVSELNLNGSLEVDCQDTILIDQLKIDVNGSGQVTCQFSGNNLETVVNGTGTLNYTGQVNEQKITINGSGDYLAKNLTSSQGEVDINGSGDIEINTQNKLKISISGSGSVDYLGDPEIDQSISGSGSIKKLTE